MKRTKKNKYKIGKAEKEILKHEYTNIIIIRETTSSFKNDALEVKIDFDLFIIEYIKTPKIGIESIPNSKNKV